jgi:hypothetical protein
MNLNYLKSHLYLKFEKILKNLLFLLYHLNRLYLKYHLFLKRLKNLLLLLYLKIH